MEASNEGGAGEKTRLIASSPSRSSTGGSPWRSGLKWPVFIMMAVAAVLLFPLLYTHIKRTSQKTSVVVKEQQLSQRPAAFVHATDVADSKTTFSELAKAMVPAWYAESVNTLHIFTPDVMPDHVYDARKILLKTRDLLDAFSPVYPNATSSRVDMWRSARKFLDRGYVLVGEFQDLYNAHVRYTDEMLEEARTKVLIWRRHFDRFRKSHHVMVFLNSPSADGSFRHAESHLFWLDAVKVPSGNDLATTSLQQLVSMQLTRALKYLNLAFGGDQAAVLEEAFHQHYHNLRKELRGLVDEFELFDEVLTPMTPETKAAVQVLKDARKILGDMNDDFTAYTIYVENDIHHKDQADLAEKVRKAWTMFKQWTDDSDFEGAIKHLADCMKPPEGELKTMAHTKNHTKSILQLLQQRRKQPTTHFVIGNEAGDADTIISALTLAYIESMRGNIPKTPIVAISRSDFETGRPEVSLLLELAGIPSPTDVLIFVDDDLVQNAKAVQVTLTDHNVLADQFQKKDWQVEEILDHHEDEGLYMNIQPRIVAFADGKGLVASACTLVEERMKNLWDKTLYPFSIGLLLLGVILLDSVNLSTQVGKVTHRDVSAVKDLLLHTDWRGLPEATRTALHMDSSSGLDTTAFFNLLQGAKYDATFWGSLSTTDALRMDFKDYYYASGKFGISTVLMSVDDFLASRSDRLQRIPVFMAEIDVSFFAIMFAFLDDGRLHRQLALCAVDDFSLDKLVAFLLDTKYESDESLDLKELPAVQIPEDADGMTMRVFEQRNIVPSRKQIGPILLQYFSDEERR